MTSRGPIFTEENEQMRQDTMEADDYNPDQPLPLRAKEMECPVCNKYFTKTTIISEIGNGNLLWGSVCCVLTPLCFWLPCVVPFCKDKRHLCPHCKSSVGLTTYL